MVTLQEGRKIRDQERPAGDSNPSPAWQQRIEYALRHLGDRSVLNSSPLARLTYVETLASEQYSGHLLPRGLALHDMLIRCVKRVSTELSNEPGLTKACKSLELISNGATCREISKQLGLSREHISRVYRKKAIELVTEQFLYLVNNVR